MAYKALCAVLPKDLVNEVCGYVMVSEEEVRKRLARLNLVLEHMMGYENYLTEYIGWQYLDLEDFLIRKHGMKNDITFIKRPDGSLRAIDCETMIWGDACFD